MSHLRKILFNYITAEVNNLQEYRLCYFNDNENSLPCEFEWKTNIFTNYFIKRNIELMDVGFRYFVLIWHNINGIASVYHLFN